MEATMQLITILQSLRELPRPLSDEENLYLDHITDEIRRAPSDAARWRIFEREGIAKQRLVILRLGGITAQHLVFGAAMN